MKYITPEMVYDALPRNYNLFTKITGKKGLAIDLDALFKFHKDNAWSPNWLLNFLEDKIDLANFCHFEDGTDRSTEERIELAYALLKGKSSLVDKLVKSAYS